ncbi:MAG: DEAD/DEAH box helicase family protein [gamma proteobacterium symbiont of Lucinoma myriamae]|nr:DEAD/DEAH box helicase family protein [gamma proteobacterium symbiont of Lucinoma myriamae]MCU7818144.1 DEAD/DEAH box helicase family protein [gamma proteobacterium symbiont of Lucinoma myriamae]MCU7832694.1 DEAD/DEAH box helicase family protein [gamma proteobacterium symbiont of Lucinoma myriamae]
MILLPRKDLKQQTIKRFNQRYPDIGVDESIVFNDGQQVCVQTYAYLLRHYSELDVKTFDYIVVDEAHHAQANGLKKILEYFQPDNLLGFTATDERLDQKNLEDIFGQYETQMTLKEAIEREIIPPISVYRLQTNIDLSKVRFNGKDFVKSDLQKTIQIPSRDELIVNLVKDSFSETIISGQPVKQGLVFCVDIKHAKRIAKLFNDVCLSAVNAINLRIQPTLL